MKISEAFTEEQLARTKKAAENDAKPIVRKLEQLLQMKETKTLIKDMLIRQGDGYQLKLIRGGLKRWDASSQYHDDVSGFHSGYSMVAPSVDLVIEFGITAEEIDKIVGRLKAK